MIFESHAHYDDDAFAEDREQLLESMREHGVGFIMNAGSDMDSCRRILELIERYPDLYGAMGVHPSETGELTEEDILWLARQCEHDKIKAIGEIGLDYYWDTPEREIQKRWFIRQLELARQTELPVIIHSRDAAKDTLDILKAEHDEETGGVIHCFSYGIEMAREYLSMGFYIGIGGVITYKNAKKLKEAAAYIPLDRILLETDSPYLAPVPNRGKRNSSLNLPYIAAAIAEIKGISCEEVMQTTCDNAKTLFCIGQDMR